jgi:hypothetical protein
MKLFTVTKAQSRKLALSLPEAKQEMHMNHPDFRVRGKIFATIWPNDKFGMVKLTPGEQAALVQEDPNVFQPVKGYWGKKGATSVCLPLASEEIVKRALIAAWRNTAPKRLSPQFKNL